MDRFKPTADSAMTVAAVRWVTTTVCGSSVRDETVSGVNYVHHTETRVTKNAQLHHDAGVIFPAETSTSPCFCKRSGTSVDYDARPSEAETPLQTAMDVDFGIGIGIDMEDPGWDLLPTTDAFSFDEPAAAELDLMPAAEDQQPCAPSALAPVFSCVSPSPDAEGTPSCDFPATIGMKRTRTQDESRPVEKRPRVRFGTVARVRHLITETAGTVERHGTATTADDCVPIKQHDGPSRVSVLLSALLIARFGQRVSSIGQLLHLLRRDLAFEVLELGLEVYEGAMRVAEKLEADGCVGMLPSHVRLTAAHKPGVQQLVAWLQPQSASALASVVRDRRVA